ncbi:MAG: RNA-binding protein [Alphaproteobacteria bacterium]|nr:RNA-binding protein [Alphaproteobacteria bacterium]
MSVDQPQTETIPRRVPDAPERRCLVTGEVHPRAELMRFVVGPDDLVVPDLDKRLPGRGLWLIGRRDIVAQACAKRSFARGARSAVTPMAGPNGESLEVFVEAELARRALNALTMARKSGEYVSGFEKVRGALAGLAGSGARHEEFGQAALLCASDAGADGRQKVAQLAAHVNDVARIDLFDAATLGRVSGRERTVHAFVLPGGAARQVRDAANRLVIYRGDLVPVDGIVADDDLME